MLVRSTQQVFCNLSLGKLIEQMWRMRRINYLSLLTYLLITNSLLSRQHSILNILST